MAKLVFKAEGHDDAVAVSSANDVLEARYVDGKETAQHTGFIQGLSLHFIADKILAKVRRYVNAEPQKRGLEHCHAEGTIEQYNLGYSKSYPLVVRRHEDGNVVLTYGGVPLNAEQIDICAECTEIVRVDIKGLAVNAIDIDVDLGPSETEEG